MERTVFLLRKIVWGHHFIDFSLGIDGNSVPSTIVKASFKSPFHSIMRLHDRNVRTWLLWEKILQWFVGGGFLDSMNEATLYVGMMNQEMRTCKPSTSITISNAYVTEN